MKKTRIFAFILISLVSCVVHSQSHQTGMDTVLTYYPLSIGNKWVFDEYATSTIPPIITIHRIWSLEIVKDTLMPNNEKYFALQEVDFDAIRENGISYERIDSNAYKVFRYDMEYDSTNFEVLTLDLSVELFGTFYTPQCEVYFAELGTISRFGQLFDFRHYDYTCGLFYPTFYYLKSIGLYKYNWYADFVESSSTLRGCIVNGVLYGDTTVISVENEDLSLPDFHLNQNYPNPFNPRTVISYQTPERSNVTIKVYDVLGNEVTTLVNQEKSVGSYEIEFNGAGLTSGIYFYQLQAGNFIETRKMILLK